MFAYIKGSLEMKFKNYIVIDVGGLGYKIFMPENSIDQLGKFGEIVKVFTYYRVREDDISIYGFNTQEQLRTFELLLSVSGVGAKSALVMLSCIEPSDFAIAVISNNIKLLTQIPGIGPKSAQRIILELKDKLKSEQNEEQLEETKAALSQLESDLEAKKAEIATLGMDAQSIVKKAQLNKEVKELVPQIETLKAEVERLSN